MITRLIASILIITGFSIASQATASKKKPTPDDDFKKAVVYFTQGNT